MCCEPTSLTGTWVNTGYNGMAFPYAGRIEIIESDETIFSVYYEYDTDTTPGGMDARNYEEKWQDNECTTYYHIKYVDAWTGAYFGLVRINEENTQFEVQFSDTGYPEYIGGGYALYAIYYREQ
jgi:hypothetical protein